MCFSFVLELTSYCNTFHLLESFFFFLFVFPPSVLGSNGQQVGGMMGRVVPPTPNILVGRVCGS